jgi:hypothetical protein
VIEAVREGVRAHVGAAPAVDDFTLMVVEWRQRIEAVVVGGRNRCIPRVTGRDFLREPETNL